jgi:hypothetical protein
MTPDTAAVIAILIGALLMIVSFYFLIALIRLEIKYRIEDRNLFRSQVELNHLTIWEIREQLKKRY